MNRNTIVGPMAIAAVTALLTGCSPADAPQVTATVTTQPAPTGSTTTPPATAAAAPDGTASSAAPTATPSVTTRTDPNAPAGQCADAHLAVSVQDDPTGSGAGQRLAYVVFHNTGTSRCVLRGAPGVSLVGDANGTQIGAAAARALTSSTVTIQPGSYALAALSYPYIDKNGGAYGDGKGHDPQCAARAADGYRVYPPHSFRAYFTRVPNLFGCSTTLQTLRVSAVAPASKFADFTPKF